MKFQSKSCSPRCFLTACKKMRKFWIKLVHNLKLTSMPSHFDPETSNTASDASTKMVRWQQCNTFSFPLRVLIKSYLIQQDKIANDDGTLSRPNYAKHAHIYSSFVVLGSTIPFQSCRWQSCGQGFKKTTAENVNLKLKTHLSVRGNIPPPTHIVR